MKSQNDPIDKGAIYCAIKCTENAYDAMPDCFYCWQTDKVRYIKWPQPIGWDTEEKEEYIKMYGGDVFSAGVHMCQDKLEKTAKEWSTTDDLKTDEKIEA